MGTTLSAALDDARRHGFVGRTDELESFDAAAAGASPARVLFVHGPGGIGKTTLLDELRRRAREYGRRTVTLDGRDVGGSIPAVERALSIGRPAGFDGRLVLLVDGYELLTPLDRWFREQLVPSLPATSVAVLAGREPPTAAWSADPGWRRLMRVHDLGALSHAESIELLCRLGVPEELRGRLAVVGRGHPLALALLAEASAGGAVPTRLDDLPDLVAGLCRVLVRDVPDADHRMGLATCAHAYRTTEDLLIETIGPRAPEVWRWLESRPFVGRSGSGLHPHDLVRDVFEAEFAQRNPEAYVDLHRRIRQHTVARLLDQRSVTRDRDATELLLLHRRSPLDASFREVRERGALAVSPAATADHSGVLDILERFEGSDDAQLARRWIEAQPAGLYVARSDAGVEAFAQHVYFTAGPGLVQDDPVTRAVLDAVERHGPLRPGERIGVGRFFGGRGPAYQREPVGVMTAAVSSLLEWTSRPVAWTFLTTLDGEFWRSYLEYIAMSVLARVRCGRHEWTVFGWDRRRFPLEAFLELTGRRELTGETGPPPAELLRPAPLGRAAFGEAVRAALRDLHRRDRLAASPLAGTALGPAPGDAIERALVQLGEEPRGDPLRRVLDRTYLRGAPSQEAAAELLGLSFSTYRRHLARATDRLVELLWAIEIGAN